MDEDVLRYDLFVIGDVPVVSCPSCGESYMTAETLHEIERLKLHRHSVEMLGEVEPRFQPCLSVPLVLEYESALRRHESKEGDVDKLLEYMCAISDHRQIYFLWRPFLSDPSVEMVLEVGVEARVDAIVTYNLKDFKGVEERFGIRVISPSDFLRELREGES